MALEVLLRFSNFDPKYERLSRKREPFLVPGTSLERGTLQDPPPFHAICALEDDFSGELEVAWIIGEDELLLVELRVSDCVEVTRPGRSNRVHCVQ